MIGCSVPHASNPAYSPDGTKLAYARYAEGLFVANADGSNERRLTSLEDSQPAWSPDGRLIAFERFDRSTSRTQIVVVRSDTGAQYAVIHGPHSAFDPAWRPAVKLTRARRGPCR